MATPLTADAFLAALKAEGVKVAEPPGWRTHNRAGHGAWGPVNGVIIHHTGGTGPGDGNVVWSGRADLPGPLAHGYLAKTGTVTMTANGRANHAGGGDGAVLAAVINESYTTAPAAPHQHDGSAGAVDGNAHFYGLEISNRGAATDPYPAVQYEAAVRWAAAICRAHEWSAKSVIGHKEWSDWKPDPSFSITQFRADVAERLAHPASWNPDTEDDMALPQADIDKIAAAVVTKLAAGGGVLEASDLARIFLAIVQTDGVLPAPADASDYATNKFWTWQSHITAQTSASRQVVAQMGALTAAVTALAKDGGITAELVAAAAEAGAKAALVELGTVLAGATSKV